MTFECLVKPPTFPFCIDLLLRSFHRTPPQVLSTFIGVRETRVSSTRYFFTFLFTFKAEGQKARPGTESVPNHGAYPYIRDVRICFLLIASATIPVATNRNSEGGSSTVA